MLLFTDAFSFFFRFSVTYNFCYDRMQFLLFTKYFYSLSSEKQLKILKNKDIQMYIFILLEALF